MLAQNFLDAETLGLAEHNRHALIKTLGVLERGEANGLFDMGPVGDPDCGVPGCILGWARTFGYRILIAELRGAEESGLFLARRCTDPARGAQALRSFLVTGHHDWEN